MKNTSSYSLSLIQKITYALICIVLLVYVFHTLREILVPIMFSGLLGFILVPICNRLESWRLPRSLSIVVALFIAFFLIFILIYFAVQQIAKLGELMPVLNQKSTIWFSKIQLFLDQNFHIDQKKIIQEGKKYIADIIKNGSSIASNALGVTLNFLAKLVLVPLYVFLFLLYRDHLEIFLIKLFKTSNTKAVKATVEKIENIIGE
ncbi:MAG: AI-2E family transporter, partial [Leadbetterella sp.]